MKKKIPEAAQAPDLVAPQPRGDVATRFPAGTSGNPAGRPKGSRNRIARELREALENDGSGIVETLVREARAGKPWAVKLSVDRLIRLRADRHVDLGLSRVDSAEQLAAATAQCVTLAAQGEISIEDAREFMKLLEQQRQAIETRDISVRLMILEEENRAAQKEKKGGRYGLPKGDE